MNQSDTQSLGHSYGRLYRSQANYRWWRPLLSLVLFGTMALIATGVMLTALLFWQMTLADAATGQLAIEELLTIDMMKPVTVFFGLGVVAVTLPLAFLANWAMNLKPVGMLHSVALRVRWGHLVRYLVPAIAMVVISTALGSALTFFFGNTTSVAPVSVDWSAAALSLLFVVLLVPVQAAAEEYAFRGILLQALNSWIRRPVIPVLLSAIAFAVLHAYDAWGLAQVFVFALGAGWLAIRTGGLESGIALHTVNNLVQFIILASGVAGTTEITSDGGGPIALVTAMVFIGGYVWWSLRVHRQLERGTSNA